ncbi:MAG: hypothetical protein HFG45_09515 [Oscillospiraceae bacterium]|jgi:hypothetical protein|nr:hypothetical protein [Oscillospiraceae bacterium]
MILLQLAGILAAKNDGAQWYNAYLLGILAVLGLASFLVLAKKADLSTPSYVNVDANSGNAIEAKKPSLRDLPGLLVLA